MLLLLMLHNILKKLSGILNGTTAFMTMVVAYFWLKESISLKQMFGIILGFLGILVLVNPANGSATLGASGFALVGALFIPFQGSIFKNTN